MWLLLALILLASPAWAGQLDATWSAPATYTDGTPIAESLTYRVYWQLFPQTPCPGTQFIVTNPGALTATLINLAQGMTYNAQVTAVGVAGESSCSAMASAPAHADPPLPAGTNLQVTYVATPPPPPFDFTAVGLTAGQVVTGTLRVQAVPSDGTTTGNHFRLDLLNASGAVVSGNDEGASPYCFVGDPGTLPCNPFDTTTIANGAYTMRIVYTKSGQTGNVTKTIPFTVSH